MISMACRGERIPCVLCESEDHHEVSRSGRNGDALTTVICKRCGLVFTNPMPTVDELNAFYRWSYRTQYKKVLEPKPKHVYRSAERAVTRWERLRSIGPSAGRILDVGSGGGEFLYLMKKVGFSASGVEPNAGYGNFSRVAYGLDITVTPVEQLDLPAHSFDVITANHVLEHVRNPLTTLKLLKSFLSREGILIVEVPNVEATYHSPNTKFHFAHVYNFSDVTLGRIAGRAGLATVDIQQAPRDQHINIVLCHTERSSNAEEVRDIYHYEHIAAVLQNHSLSRHYLSRHPYSRLMRNLIRPVREKLAVRGKNIPREILDTVFDSVVAQG